METVQVEVWVMVDEDGSYMAHEDRDALAERYKDEMSDDPTIARRMVKVTLNVPKPAPVELVATVAEEPATGELRVA